MIIDHNKDCSLLPFDLYEDLLVIFHFQLMDLPSDKLQAELDRIRDEDAHWDDLSFT